MTTKDYIKLSKVMAANRPDKDTKWFDIWEDILFDLIKVLKEENQLFNEEFFRKECMK